MEVTYKGEPFGAVLDRWAREEAQRPRFWRWLRDQGVTAEWYEIKTYGLWYWLKGRHCQVWAESLNNVIAWLPIIWRDRDFDHSYLVTMMTFKLRRMANHFEQHAMVSQAPRHARECRTVATLIDRACSDDYYFDVITRDSILAARKAQARDLKVAFRIMERRLLTWWD